MGEDYGEVFRPTFQGALKVRGLDERLTSDGGAVLLREADHRLGLVKSLAGKLFDPRNPEKIRYELPELLRERIFSLALGYSTQDDVDRLAHDPAMRMACWDRQGEKVLDERMASQPTQSRLIDTLANFSGNLEAVRDALADWSERWLCSTGADRRAPSMTVDVDSFFIACCGNQPGVESNGHFQDAGYHPLVASFTVGGHYDSSKEGKRLGSGFLHATLRAGNVHTANGMLRFLHNTIAQSRRLARSFEMRLDAGFTSGRTMDYLTDEKVRFIGRLKTNAVLDRLAAPYLKRPAGRPPKEGYEMVIDLGYHAAEGWRHAQRVILVIVDAPDSKSGQLALEPDYFFIITNWRSDERTGEQVLERYRQRGTFEDRLGEFRAAIGPKLSSPTFRENEALLLLSLLAYNLASTLREELESSGACWDLRRFQATVLKAGGRVTKGSRYVFLNVARAVVPFWQRVTQAIAAWIVPERFQTGGPHRHPFTPPPRHAHRNLVLRD